jgi:hypothetical protein
VKELGYWPRDQIGVFEIIVLEMTTDDHHCRGHLKFPEKNERVEKAPSATNNSSPVWHIFGSVLISNDTVSYVLITSNEMDGWRKSGIR